MSRVNLTIADADNDKSIIPIDFSGGFSGDIIGLAQNAWGVINPLVNGTLVGASVTLEVDISDFTNAAAAAIADVQEKAEFVFGTVGNAFLKRISLPTFIETFFTGSGAGKAVDVTQSAVAAFITLMEDGFTDSGSTPVTVRPTTSHGEDLVNYVSGKQSWGKERR